MKSQKWMVFLAPIASLVITAFAQQTPRGVLHTPQQDGIDIAAPQANFPWATISSPPANKGGVDLSGDYEVVPNWPRPLHPDWTWGRVGGIWADNPDRVFVFQNGELPRLEKPIGYATLPTRAASAARDFRWEHILMIFDRNGKFIDSWEQYNHLFVHPHNVTINPYDPERHVWLVDSAAQSIYKFTNDGKKLVMTLGEFKVAGNDTTHFGGPTGIAFLPNGDFYVSDGYQNARVVKFSKDGKYLMEWGKHGKGPGEFYAVHSIAIDAKQRIYVADRANARIQVFDTNGKFLDQWPNIAFPLYVAVSTNQYVWVSDGYTHRMLKYDLNGKLLYSWGTFGFFPGEIWGVHQFSTDSEGNVYTAEVYGGRPQKFRPKRGADPTKLIETLLQ